VWPRQRALLRDQCVRSGGEQLAHEARQRIQLADTRVEDEIAAFDEAKSCKFRQSYLAGKGFGVR
jgi:hypothetical protein